MMRIAIVRSLAVGLSLAALPLAHASAQSVAPSATPISITENTWSGEVEDSPGGHGAMTINFSLGQFTMGNSLFTRSGGILNFSQSSPDEATFTLRVHGTVGCEYSATARVADGHLKGSYSGCSITPHKWGGTFDLVPVASPSPSPTPEPTAKPSPTPRPTREPTPTPAERRAMAASAALITTTSNAEAHYCKTAAQMACSYYMGHAGGCLSLALGADAVYQGVVAMKKTGFTSTQVQAQEDQIYGPDSDKALIAAAALKMIDEHEHYDSGAFEMAILRLCLAGIAQ